eukprot:1136941-Pelagomonas_calceolata.AAC.7
MPVMSALLMPVICITQAAYETNALVAKPDSASFTLSVLDPAMRQTARIDFRHLVAMNYAGNMCTVSVMANTVRKGRSRADSSG